MSMRFGHLPSFHWSFNDLYTPLAVIDADGKNLVNLSKITGLKGWSPSWSPVSKRLVVAATPKTGVKTALYIMDADGSNRHG